MNELMHELHIASFHDAQLQNRASVIVRENEVVNLCDDDEVILVSSEEDGSSIYSMSTYRYGSSENASVHLDDDMISIPSLDDADNVNNEDTISISSEESVSAESSNERENENVEDKPGIFFFSNSSFVVQETIFRVCYQCVCVFRSFSRSFTNTNTTITIFLV